AQADRALYITIQPQGATATTAGNVNNFLGVAGYYDDANHVCRGFVRDAWGRYTLFDLPGSCHLYGHDVPPFQINDAGEILGNYDYLHQIPSRTQAFVRYPNGTITLINIPDSQSTLAYGINVVGAITGWYLAPNVVEHLFVRSPQGTLTVFD